MLTITLEKLEAARSARLHFWSRAVVGHPEIDVHALPAMDGAQSAALGALGLLDGAAGGGVPAQGGDADAVYARAMAAASLGS